MSLKCSVFGHQFGDTDVEREREEDGSEVVITIKEVETCQRCGTQRVVSENKEVTTLETPEPEDVAGSTEEADGEAGGAVAGSARADDADHADDAEIVDEEPTIPDAEGGPAADVAAPEEAEAPAEAPDADATDPATDDGVILDESEPAESRDAGQWPEDTLPDEGTTAAESIGESNDASTAKEVEVDPGAEAPEDREPGEWPEEPADDSPDWQPETDGQAEERPRSDQGGQAVTVPEGTFHCPECGFSTPVEASSLREGDFCPECHRGSLEHHADEE